MKKKIFCFDLDNTLCSTKKSFYHKSKPKKKAIKIVNLLFDKGHNIKIYTARYMGRSNDSLQNKRKILDQILLIHKSEGKLDGQSFLALKKLKKECTKIYNENFNFMGKSFDDEYMPVRFKVDPKGKFEDY